jgi:hypothetical protein
VASGWSIIHGCTSSIAKCHLRLSIKKDEEAWGGQVYSGVHSQFYDGEKGIHGSRWKGGIGAVGND